MRTDVKAAERMAKLFDEIKKDNPNDSPDFIHGLNVFLCRLLFCFFAEDTNIFEKGQFTYANYQINHIGGASGTAYICPTCTTMTTNGNCPGKAVCKKILHPLVYYRRKVWLENKKQTKKVIS